MGCWRGTRNNRRRLRRVVPDALAHLLLRRSYHTLYSRILLRLRLHAFQSSLAPVMENLSSSMALKISEPQVGGRWRTYTGNVFPWTYSRVSFLIEVTGRSSCRTASLKDDQANIDRKVWESQAQKASFGDYYLWRRAISRSVYSIIRSEVLVVAGRRRQIFFSALRVCGAWPNV